MSKVVFKIGGTGVSKGPGWIGGRFFPTPGEIVELDTNTDMPLILAISNSKTATLIKYDEEKKPNLKIYSREELDKMSIQDLRKAFSIPFGPQKKEELIEDILTKQGTWA